MALRARARAGVVGRPADYPAAYAASPAPAANRQFFPGFRQSFVPTSDAVINTAPRRLFDLGGETYPDQRWQKPASASAASSSRSGLPTSTRRWPPDNTS